MFSLFVLVGTIVLVLLIHRINGLKRRIDFLEQKIATLPEFAGEPSPFAPEPEKAAQDKPPAQTASRPVSTAHQRPSRTRAEWEALVGGKVLNRIGALAIIVGAGFFLKYSFDNNWITESMRVLIGAVVGIGLLLAALRYRKRNLSIFAQGLAGAGLSILYLSIYAAFNFYHLLPQITALVLMALVTAIALGLALIFDVTAVSMIGWAGGYLTPFLLSTDRASETGLFSYILLLQLGLLLVAARKKTWSVLVALTVAATYVVFFSWYGQYYTNDDLWLTLLFLTLFWALFFAYELFDWLRAGSTPAPLKMLAAILNVSCYYAGLYILLFPKYFDQSALVTLALGAIYFLASLALMRKKTTLQKAIRQQMVIAIILLVIATAIYFSDFVVVTLWAAEAALLIYCSVRWRLSYVRTSGVVLLVVAWLALLYHHSGLAYYPIESFRLLFTTRFLAYLALAAAFAAGAILLRRESKAGTAQTVKMLQFGLCATVFLMLTVETLDAFEKNLYFLREQALQSDTLAQIDLYKNLQQLTLSGVWLLYSIALMAAGLWRRIAGWRMAAIALFGISILKVFIYDLSFLDTLYRIISFISLGIILLAVSYLYQKYKDVIFQKEQHVTGGV